VSHADLVIHGERLRQKPWGEVYDVIGAARLHLAGNDYKTSGDDLRPRLVLARVLGGTH
jgi:hypothetical protein